MSAIAVSSHTARQGSGSRCARVVVVLVAVLLGTALFLRVLDGVPPWLRAEPREIRRYQTVEALEREIRTQLLLPFYFPDILAWPPAAVYRAPGDGVPTVVSVSERASGQTRLLVAQCVAGECAFPARLLPRGEVRAREPIEVGDVIGERITQAGPGGATWTDIEWREGSRRFVVRMYGDDRELPRIARSLRRGHP
jgi:hypothetical protein